MSKFNNWCNKWIPIVWAILWVISVTVLSVNVVIWSIKWLLSLVGVL